MSSTGDPKASDVVDPPDAARRAEARRSLHYVTSHGTERVCAAEDCNTQLSRYNKAKWCWVHDPSGR